MPPLRIQCETCGTSLRVRDEGFIGEVHACPRCGSMVLISGDHDAAAASDPTALALSETLQEVAPPAEIAQLEPSVAEPTSPPPPAEAAPAAEVTSPVASWAPVATTAASLLATGVIASIWLASLGTQTTTAVSAEPVVESPEAPAIAETDRTPAKIEKVEKAEPPIEEIAVIDPPAEEQSLAPVVEEETPPLVASREAPRIIPETREAFVAPPPQVIDPLAFDPAEVRYALQGKPPAEDRPSADLARDQAIEVEKELERAVQRAGLSVRLGPTDATTLPYAGSAAVALTYAPPKIELREVPLDVACQLVGELAGVAITLPPDALRRAGVAADKPVNLIGEGKTLGEVLAAGLRPVRLTATTEGPFVTIRRAGGERVREITHDLADLAGENPEALWTLLNEQLDLDPLPEINRAGELPLTAPMWRHYDLLVCCELLRAERGMASNSKYPLELLLNEEQAERLEAKLQRRTTFSFVTPTPLAEVVAYWRRALDMPVLVDWRSLADIGLGPRSQITCSATNRPWRASLSGVLEPIGLTWEPAFGGSIWVTVASD